MKVNSIYKFLFEQQTRPLTNRERQVVRYIIYMLRMADIGKFKSRVNINDFEFNILYRLRWYIPAIGYEEACEKFRFWLAAHKEHFKQ